MNKGSQSFVNSLCCLCTVALACSEGTSLQGLSISRVFLLTVGNSRTAASRTAHSSVVSNSFFANSKLIVHAGILKTSHLFLVTGFRFQNLGQTSMGLSLFPRILHCSCSLQLHTNSSGSLTFPKCTVSLICALKFSSEVFLRQLSAVPSRMLITCASGNAYVTASIRPGMHTSCLRSFRVISRVNKPKKYLPS